MLRSTKMYKGMILIPRVSEVKEELIVMKPLIERQPVEALLVDGKRNFESDLLLTVAAEGWSENDLKPW